MIKVGLVFSIANFFINKTYQANNCSRKKIPSLGNLALDSSSILRSTYNLQKATFITFYMATLRIPWGLKVKRSKVFSASKCDVGSWKIFKILVLIFYI